MDARTLHIANGSATTSLIERAGIPGDRSIWADPLHDGPVPDGITNDRLRELRAKYFARLLNEDDWHGFFDEVTRWDAAAQNAGAYDEVVLWFEHDLFDQLNLIQLLDRLNSIRQPSSLAVSLICIDRFPGRPHFKGLGELTPHDISMLLPTRQRVTDDQFALAQRSWRAFTASDPRAIEAVLAAGTSALPFLANALHRYLEEFPDSVTGLSRTERRILEIGATPTLLKEAFWRMHDGEDAFFIADLSFWDVVRTLAAAEPALLELSDLPADVLDLRRVMATVRIKTTNVGRTVVDGRQDRVTTTGIDTWKGGVHLAGRDAVWRWNRRSHALTHAGPERQGDRLD